MTVLTILCSSVLSNCNSLSVCNLLSDCESLSNCDSDSDSLSVCDSLKTMDFKPLDESEFDMGKTMKRHGSVVVITDEEYDRMAEAFGLE